MAVLLFILLLLLLLFLILIFILIFLFFRHCQLLHGHLALKQANGLQPRGSPAQVC